MQIPKKKKKLFLFLDIRQQYNRKNHKSFAESNCVLHVAEKVPNYCSLSFLWEGSFERRYSSISKFLLLQKRLRKSKDAKNLKRWAVFINKKKQRHFLRKIPKRWNFEKQIKGQIISYIAIGKSPSDRKIKFQFLLKLWKKMFFLKLKKSR